jgi:hypothetical protein
MVVGEALVEANMVPQNLILGWDWGKWTCDLFVEYQLYNPRMDGVFRRFQPSLRFDPGVANSRNVCLGMPGSKHRRQRASYIPRAPTTIRSVDSTSL